MEDNPAKQAYSNDAQGNALDDIAPVVGPPTSAIPEFAPAQPQHENARKRSNWTKDKGMFWVTFAGVVAVVGYTAVSYWQGTLTRKSIDLAEQTAIRQLR